MNNSGSSSSSITALVPGGVVTTQNISTVIKPKENNNSMQFVKIQTPELSKKAVEQIRVAQESKITKDKIKEVEEEWQSNLLNWKSKRRQQFVGVHPSKSDQNQEEQNNNDANNENGRKIKTFAEMIEQRAKAGNRLNFHLERYIGSSEDDNPEEDEDDNLSQANEHDQNGTEIENNNNINDSNNVSSNATLDDDDGDRLSIGGEDVVDRSAQQSQHSNKIIISNSKLIQKEKTAYINDIVSDNSVNINNNKNVPNVGANGAGDSFVNKNGVKLHSQEDVGREKVESDVDDDDDYEEQYSEQRPINSTFIKGIEQPPTPPTIHSNVSIKPPLDESATKRQVSLTDNARFDSVSEEEEHEEEEEEDEEEDEEEEEEQKQLQRIAFVQKLKAFEKMTKPSLQEPRFVPTRAAKPQPPAPPPPPPPPQPVATRCSPVTSQPPPASICSSQSQSRLPSVKEVQPPPPPPPMPRPKLQHRAETTQVSPVPRPPPQPHPPAQTIQRVVEPKPDLPSPVPAPIPSTISSKTTIPQPPPPPRARPRTPSPPAPPKQPTARQQMIAPTLTPPIAPISPPQRQKHQAPQPQQPVTSRQQPLGQQQQQHQQQTPPLSSREEKSQDRTVLSVSGKKRCSSCKEELGRGAAAFVIESLNLVYHTNCFRCSVCHVNLSNGFRGVDVRVHAGALHCQNCYSKDGLNYSRV